MNILIKRLVTHFLLIPFCFLVLSCNEFRGNLVGYGYSNREAGFRFLTSKNGKKTEIDGFYVESSLINQEEWNLNYIIDENDFYWASERNGFGKDYIWIDSNKKQAHYDSLTGGFGGKYFDVNRIHFRIFALDIQSIKSLKESLNIKKITITIDLKSNKFDDLFFLAGDKTVDPNSRALLEFFLIFEDKNLEDYQSSSQQTFSVLFIINTPYKFTNANWMTYEEDWNGAQYVIELNRHMEISSFLYIETTHTSDYIWNGQLSED